MSAPDSAPDSHQNADLTLLLNRMQSGDREAGDRAVAMVYDELHRLAARHMRRERGDGQLQPTALIHEAYSKLADGGVNIQNRQHFFAIASRQMRRLLVDAARSEKAQKRGGPDYRLPLDELKVASPARGEDLVALDEALDDFEKLEPRASKVVELRYFGGYTDAEVAEALNVALSTVRRDWEFARSWLYNRLHGDSGIPA